MRATSLFPGVLRNLLRDRRAVSALEFALVLPVVMILAVGTIEYGRIVLLTQKIQNGAFILADLTARDKTVNVEQMENIFLALGNIIQPFDIEANGVAFVTSVGVPNPVAPVVNWQRSGAGGLATASTVGLPGGSASLPADLTLATGDTIIVAEVFYRYEPIFTMIAEPRTMRTVAYYKPRLGTLETLLP